MSGMILRTISRRVICGVVAMSVSSLPGLPGLGARSDQGGLPGRIGPVPAAAQSVPAMEAAAARYREVQALCADFEQSIEVRLIRRTIESAGRICQQRPNLFSMRFSQPDGDMVVSDGEHFWIYYPSVDAEQVMRRPAAGSPGGEDFFRELLDAPGARYDADAGGIEPVEGRDCRVVSLVPRQSGHYRRARIWLDVQSHLIRRVEIHEQSGNVRTVTLRNVDLAPALDPETFVFEVPPGARVMGGASAGLLREGGMPVQGTRDAERLAGTVVP